MFSVVWAFCFAMNLVAGLFGGFGLVTRCLGRFGLVLRLLV